MTEVQIQVITVLVFGLVGCLISLVTWLGLDRQSPGPQLWTASFLLYTFTIFISFLGLGHGLYSAYQLPLLALLTVANWLQYRGFRAFLTPGTKAITLAQAIVVVLIGAGCSAVSFLVASPVITFAIENGLGLALTIAILTTFLRRKRPFNRPLAWFIVSLLIVALVVGLASTGGVVAVALLEGPSAPVPQSPLAFGPLKWLVSLVLLALVENLLVTGTLVEEKALALRDSEEEKKRTHALNEELHEIQRDILGTMALTFEKRTIETAAHVERVANLTERLLIQLGYPASRARLVGDAARLHDIGKIGISDEILKSSDVLSPEERKQMELHTLYGHQILSKMNNEFFQLAARIAFEHHEHWDGSGYPQGLQAAAISPEARAVSIVDTFDALTSRRSYKDP